MQEGLVAVAARRTSILLCLSLAALLLGLTATEAVAKVESRVLSPETVKRSGVIVFELRGVKPDSVRHAVIRVGQRRKRIKLSRVRGAARRGYLRLRPRGLRSKRAQASARRIRLRLRLQSKRHRVVPPNALWVSESGSDSNPGTSAQPWQTLEHATEKAPAGATVVLRPGSYGARGTITRLDRNGVHLMSDPSAPRPQVLGQVRLDAPDVKVSGVVFDGPTGGVANRTGANPGGEDVQVWMRADRTAVIDSEVRNNLWHAGIFVSDGAAGVEIADNHIHHNGNFGDPRQSNLDHGIYFGDGSGRIENNRVENNLSYGVHLYPNAHNVTVSDNTISGNRKGGVIVAERSSNNSIVGNTITRNRLGITTYALSGGGNVARSNYVRGNWEGNFGELGGLKLIG